MHISLNNIRIIILNVYSQLIYYNKYVKLDSSQQEAFNILSKELLNNSEVLKMQEFIQHGNITTYSHCINVAKMALYLSQKLNINVNNKTLIQACILHDFFLYDWHKANIRVPLFKMHGFTHALIASENAKKLLNVDDRTCEIIKSHMWPLNITYIPKSKEAWLLCIADKICATKEMVVKNEH